jgi:tetratricopeptide (TPR) repeat protein
MTIANKIVLNRYVAGALLAAAIFGVPHATRAQTNDVAVCESVSGQASIDACTRLIASKQFTGAPLATIFNNRGEAYDEMGDDDKAFEDFSEAIKLNPAFAAAYDNRAELYRWRGEYERGIADYAEAIRLDPANPAYWNGRCWMRATMKRDLQEALRDCDEALKRLPNSANALDSRALTLFQMGRLDEALASYNAALAAQPNKPHSLYGRGLVKLKKGDNAGGEADLAAAKAAEAEIELEFAHFKLN